MGILYINYTSIWKKNRVGEWRGNHRRCCTPQSPQGLGGLLYPSGLGVLIIAFQNDGNERRNHSGSFQTNWVCFVLYIFFSFLCWCDFTFIEICKCSTNALYPDLSVVNILSYLLYQSHSQSLSLPPTIHKCVDMCIYIYIERERERERWGGRRHFPFLFLSVVFLGIWSLSSVTTVQWS